MGGFGWLLFGAIALWDPEKEEEMQQLQNWLEAADRELSDARALESLESGLMRRLLASKGVLQSDNKAMQAS